MLDIEKQITFWRHSAQEDLTVAQELLERGRIRFSASSLGKATQGARVSSDA
jgi:hypothetical protein